MMEASYPLFEVAGGIPASPKMLELEEMPMRTAQALNARWHSMLPRTDLGNLLCGRTSVAYGAIYSGRWYAVAIWSQPIIAAMCDGKTIELRRLAICDDAPKYTATWMLSKMRKALHHKWPFLQKAISYQALDIHKGTIYKAAGWRAVGKVSNARPQRFSGVNKRTRATGPLQTKSRKQRWECEIGKAKNTPCRVIS